MSSSASPLRSHTFAVVLSLLVLVIASCGGGDSANEPAVATATTDTADAAPGDVVPGNISAPEAAATDPAPRQDLGGGTITIDGLDYVFVTQFCANDEDGIFNQGQGTTADGAVFSAGIVAQPFNDGYLTTVGVTLGADGIYGGYTSGGPRFETNTMRDPNLDVTIEGTSVSGSGEIADREEVVLAAGETLPMTFDGQCG